MTIEEKAQRYDEALERAKKINNEQRAQPFDVMTRVFPELKESDDERIRKEEPVSGLDNGDMSIERWKQAVKAASNQRSYRSSKGLTETRDDYFVDGVQWADEHPKEEPVSEDLEDAASSFARKDSEGISNPANFYYTIADKARIFKAGAEWQKARLMANATEAQST